MGGFFAGAHTAHYKAVLVKVGRQRTNGKSACGFFCEDVMLSLGFSMIVGWLAGSLAPGGQILGIFATRCLGLQKQAFGMEGIAKINFRRNWISYDSRFEFS